MIFDGPASALLFFSILTIASSNYDVMSEDTGGLVANGYSCECSEQESQHTVGKN